MIKRTSTKQPRILTNQQLAAAVGGLTLDLDVLAVKVASYKDTLTAWGASEIDLKA